MSKNLTRKGIAFGAIVALGTTLFAGAPASATGIDNGNVSLAPNVGAEYDIIAGGAFDLKANFANAAKTTGAYLKFQVADAAAKTTVTPAGTSQYSVVSGATPAITVSSLTVTLTVGTHRFKVGDNVAITGSTGIAGVNSTGVAITAVAATTITYVQPAGTTMGSSGNGGAATTVALLRSTPTSGVYIYDTKDDTNLADKTLRLQSTDEDVSQSVTVTAWVDNNDNGTIDTTESRSPARTVNFLQHSAITPTVAFNPIAVGADSTVVANVTFTPVLNGSQIIAAHNQNGAANALTVNFTRPGSSATLVSDSTSYSNTTKQWTVTSPNLNIGTGDDVEVAGSTNTGWAIAQPVAANLFIGSVSITKDVVTATTSTTGTRGTPTAHGLQVGDSITIASSTTARADITVATKVLSVPSTTTFTYAAAATGVDLAATAQAAGAITVTKILRNFAVAGTYTAQVLLYKNGTADILTKLGAAASSTGVAVSASTATIEPVSSATLGATSTTAASVFTGTKTAAFLGKVLDKDGAAVGAGLDASITATTVTSAGTVKINGTTVVTGTVVFAKTDASGQVAISVENSSALVGESVVLDLDIQGVDAADVTATWADRVYSIVDLNDPSVVSSPARTRAVAEGASYTFDLLVLDQFKAPAGADLRLKASLTGNTVATQIVPLTAGKATVAVADGGLTTGDVTVAMGFQKLTGTTWADVDSATYVDWEQSHNNDLAPVAIKYYTQTDALTLNADAANFPSSIAADYSAATSTKAAVAVDSRVSNTAPTAVVAAGKAVVSGAVTNASTGAAKSGQVVSISGAGLLFKSGDVWSIGSATQIAADGSFAFDVYSNNPGTKVATVAVGSVTKTASLVFTGASSAVRKLTISGDQFPTPGSTLRAEILLVDGNGNGVDTVAPATTPVSEYISVSYDGPGLLSGAALPTETDKDGKASVRYLLGVGDRGAATVTVKFDANFDGDFVDATDITVTRVYNIGGSAVATAAVAGSTNRMFVSVSNNTLARNVVIKVAGRTVATLKGSTAKKTYVVRSTKGSKKVTVFVGGKLIANKTVTVK